MSTLPPDLPEASRGSQASEASEASALHDRIARLSPEKRALLERRLRDRALQRAEAAAIAPRDPSTSPPLSFAQQRLWFLDQLEPGGAHYNIPRAVRLNGLLDRKALVAALSGLVARHESLRTRLVAQHGEGIQQVDPPRPVSLSFFDLRDHPADDRTPRLHGLLREEAFRPFDLAADLMLRAALFQTGPEEHVLLLVVHHVAADAWSIGILQRELSALYRAAHTGNAPGLPALPIQYADYAIWQRAYLEGERLDRQIAYWRDQLADTPPLAFHTDRPRPTRLTHDGAALGFRLPETVGPALGALCRQEQATLFMGLMAGFQALLHHYTGQCDIAVGTPIAGRTRPETEPLIGFFVNSLVIRSRVERTDTFRGLLRRVRDTAREAFTHQDVPFEKLVEELRPQRDRSRSPFFQVMLALQNAPRGALAFPGLEIAPIAVGRRMAKFDFEVHLIETARGLRGHVDYNTTLYDRETIVRLTTHFGRLLEAAVTAPDRPLGDLPLLDEQERRRLIIDANPAPRPYPKTRSLVDLFAARAAAHPQAVAVAAGETQLSYAALDARSGALARRLRAAGVRPGDRVGMHLDRSIAAVVAMLGILRTGAAYVPLDPEYPIERLRFMIRDAGVQVVLARKPFPELEEAKVFIDIGAEHAGPASSDADDPPPIHPLASAYIIYTSGSTGRPKGIDVPHRAIVRLVTETDYIALTPDDVVGHASNTAFDAATFEVWGALLSGARLDVLDRSVVLDPNALAEAVQARGVTTLFLTTALLNTVVRHRPDAFASLRHLLFGGEAADPAVVRSLLEQGPPERLLHVYGPTESTTFATWARVDAVDADATTVPIGRAIAHTTAYVLDEALRPVPFGVPGELVLGGDGLAHGYHARPGLTAERFVPNPFSADPGARLYRTGDRVRRRNDGGLEFLTRLDSQVKLRGFRIELGEIEAALTAHPDVAAAVVVLHERTVDTGGSENQLVAYVAASPTAAGTSTQASAPTSGLPSALRRRLAGTLPAYMMPAAIIVLDSLPLTPNGKLDRSALPDPADMVNSGAALSALPRDPIELRLVHLWEDVLNRPAVGVNDSFFDLGGHSLLAIRLMAFIEEEFGRVLPLDALFQSPTIRTLARTIREETAFEPSCLVPIQPEGSRPPFFCVPPAAEPGLVFARLARLLGRDQPFYGLTPPPFELDQVSKTWFVEIAADYAHTIRRVQPEGPYFLGGRCYGGTVALEVARHLQAAGEEVALLAMMDCGLLASYRLPTIPWGAKLVMLLYEGAARLNRLLRKGTFISPVYQRISREYATEEQIQHAHTVVDAFVRAAERYRITTTYPGAITLIHSQTFDQNPLYRRGWAAVAEGRIDYHIMGGPHSASLQEPYIRNLARILRACIDEAMATHGIEA